MYIKKSLFALTLVSLCSVSYAAEEKSKVSRIFSFITSPVVAPALAVGMTTAEDAVKKYRHKRYWDKAGFSHMPFVKNTLPMRGAGPARDMNGMLITYGCCDHYGIENLTETDYAHLESRIADLDPKNNYFDKDCQKLRGIVSHHQSLKNYLKKDLPKTFYRYAFYRNLALVWGSMHLYNAYKGTKKETYR